MRADIERGPHERGHKGGRCATVSAKLLKIDLPSVGVDPVLTDTVAVPVGE